MFKGKLFLVRYYGGKMERRFGKDFGNDAQTALNDFVDLMANNLTEVMTDIHFTRMSDQCLVCDIHYDYIFRLETMDQDLYFLQER